MSSHRYQPKHLWQPLAAARSCAVSGLEMTEKLRDFAGCMSPKAEGTN